MERLMKHITGKGICWSIYGIVLGTLLYVGIAGRIAEAGHTSSVVAIEETQAEESENESGEMLEAEEVIESEEAERQIFVVSIKPSVTPKPIERPRREIDEYPRNYKVEEEDVDKIAQLLWSSPLRSESTKKTLVWVVLNRVDDKSGIFGDSIEEVVVKSEFSFFDRHAHISDKNRKIVREVLQAWKAEKDGYYVGRHCPSYGVYIRFIGEDNRDIEVTGTIGGLAIEW